MKNRERFKRIMNFEDVDRVPVIEFASYWDETLSRWIEEGLNPDLIDEIQLRENFGLDDYRQFWIEPYSRSCPLPKSHGMPIITDDCGYRNIRNSLYPIAPWDSRLLEKAASMQDSGASVIWITLEGFFWFPRYLLGIENHLYAFYDNPDLIHSINDELADYHCRVIEELRHYCIPDFMTFAEDLSYNSGSMISKDLYDEFILPYHRRVVSELHSQGTLCFLDSDGLVQDIIPWFMDSGMDGCLPCERNAGNHPAEIRRMYPEWLMIGGIEKRTLYGNEDVLREELLSMFSVAQNGGFIQSVDHQTPPEVSLVNYYRYLKILLANA